MNTIRQVLAGLCGVVGGLLFACLLGLHMHNQAAAKNARISHMIGPKLQGVVEAVSEPHKQTYVSTATYGGTGLYTEKQRAATLRYRTASGKTMKLRIFPADGLVKNQKLSFYVKPGGNITTESGKEPPKSIWANIFIMCGLLGVVVGIVVGGISAILLERPWKPRPAIRITG